MLEPAYEPGNCFRVEDVEIWRLFAEFILLVQLQGRITNWLSLGGSSTLPLTKVSEQLL